MHMRYEVCVSNQSFTVALMHKSTPSKIGVMEIKHLIVDLTRYIKRYIKKHDVRVVVFNIYLATFLLAANALVRLSFSRVERRMTSLN